MNKSEVSGVVFLDLRKASELVDHDILLKKLTIYLKTSYSLSFFKLYIDNRMQCELKKKKSETIMTVSVKECNVSYSMALTPLKTQ